MERFAGKVISVRKVDNHEAIIELAGVNRIFHLYVEDVWVIEPDDSLVLVGHLDPESGHTNCCGYRNLTNGVHGMDTPPKGPVIYLILGVVFFWLVLPLIAGIRDALTAVDMRKGYRAARELLYAE